MKIDIDRYVFRRADGLKHGPTTFVWWRPIVISVVACVSEARRAQGVIPSWNIWIYTRWDHNRCIGFRWRGWGVTWTGRKREVTNGGITRLGRL